MNSKNAAFSPLALDLDTALMRKCYMPGDGQPQPRSPQTSAPGLVNPVEPLK